VTLSPHPLADVQVVDLTTEIAGPYCTKLFADAGAQVIKVEPAGGDPLRRYAATVELAPDEDGALFRYLNGGKQSIVVALDDPRIDALLAGADLLVEDGTQDALDVNALRLRHPHLVIASITPFGRTGPLAGQPASDLTLQAESGALLFKGDRALPPVPPGGRVGEFLGGLFAAPGALAAVLRARDTGIGEHVDLSVHDVLAIAGSNYMQVMYDIIGRPPISAPIRTRDTPGIEVASDGFVGVNTNTGHMLQMFLLLIERPDLMDEPAYMSLNSRLAMSDWQQTIDAWFGTHQVAEILEAAGALRIAVAPVHDAATVLDDEHLRARNVFVMGEDGMLRPRPPYLLDGQALDATRRAPRLGEHDTVVVPRTPRPRVAVHEHPPLPLEGLKIVDLTSWWVGALATHTLALLGADVIHVEGVGHPDGMRLTGTSIAKSPDWWEWGHMFAAANTSKRGIALDIATAEGRRVLDQLVEWADVLVENFAPRVADSWGLTAEAVLERNPNIVYQRMPAHGLSGPWRDRPAFAQTIEPMSGMAAITGSPAGPPVSKGGLPDPIAGTHGAWALLVALAQRRSLGRGVFSESVMIESALNVCAQPVLEYSAYGTVMARMGNRSPHAAPQGIYAGAAPEDWLTISVTNDEQWLQLALAVGGTSLADDPRYATASNRRDHHDELDELLQTWAAGRSAAAASSELRALGVPAGFAWDPRLVDEHPQYRARQLFTPVDHPVLGRHQTPGLAYRFTSVDEWVRSPAPTFGQHNDEILRDVLGLTDSDIAALHGAGVVGDHPRGL
jgi:crotonobetainyl-CoA:carnitine CoA-transferase CaiB-like acyl-CoA transferase